MSGGSLSDKITDGIFGCSSFSVSKENASKLESRTGKLSLGTTTSALEVDLSRGVGCACDTLECQFRAQLLSLSYLLSVHKEYPRYLELIGDGFENDPKRLQDLRSEMESIEKQVQEENSKRTCFGVEINSNLPSASDIQNWEITLVDHQGVGHPLELNKMNKVSDKSVFNDYAVFFTHDTINRLGTLACSEELIDTTQSFSLDVRSKLKGKLKNFTLKWL